MTLLIVLASIAAMEFLLRRQARAPDDSPQQWARRHLCRPRQPESNTAGLIALSDALERNGPGKAPEATPAKVRESAGRLALHRDYGTGRFAQDGVCTGTQAPEHSGAPAAPDH